MKEEKKKTKRIVEMKEKMTKRESSRGSVCW